MITIQNLSVNYGEISVLRDISIEISQGEFVLITGPSGCGKTTLARAICGLIPHALPAQIQGQVIIDGQDTQAHRLTDLAQSVNIVFQNPSEQLFHLNVQDEVAFGPRNLGLTPEEIQERTEWALNVTGLANLRYSKVRELSGGQKQCLSIAATLAMRPSVLVLDEPTASLDAPNSSHFLDTLTCLNQEHGVTILLIEHRFAAFTHQLDRVIIMDAGEIVADGNPRQILNDKKYRQTLGLRRVSDLPTEPWPSLIKANNKRPTQIAPLLTLDQVSAGYNRKPVIHQVDLAIYPRDFVALVGDNGAGKSTLARVAAGLVKPLTGSVRFWHGSRPRAGLDISILFQNPSDQLITDSVEEEIAFGPRNYGVFDTSFNQEVLQKTDLVALRYRKPFALSVGQQQRTALAACLTLQPQLVILDEPTLGQDWGHLQQMMDFLSCLNQAGMAILLISHDYKLVHRYAHRVLMMEQGRISHQGKWADSLPIIYKDNLNEIINS